MADDAEDEVSITYFSNPYAAALSVASIPMMPNSNDAGFRALESVRDSIEDLDLHEWTAIEQDLYASEIIPNFIVAAFGQAFHAREMLKNGDADKSWSHAIWSAMFIGAYLGGQSSDQQSVVLEISKRCRAAADVRHAENRKIEVAAIEMFKSGRFGTIKDEASDKIAELVGRKRDTVRGWLKGI